MLEAETYHSVTEKKEKDRTKLSLSNREAMIRCLNFLDFRAAIDDQNPNQINATDKIDWIELNFLDHDKQ